MNTLTLLVPGLLSPPVVASRLRELMPPADALSTIVGKADCDVFGGPDTFATLATLAGTTSLAAGALRAGSEDGWWCADPVHLTADPDGMRLFVPEVGGEEAAALATALSEALEVDVRCLDGNHWIAALGRLDCDTTPVPDALGARVDTHLPRGPDATRLRQWINEAQMVLHEHPVNRRRVDRGDPPVNTVWPWGGSADGQAPEWPYSDTFASEPAVAALGAGGPVPSGFDTLPREGASLVWLSAVDRATRIGDPVAWVDAIATLEQDWFAPVRDAILRGACDELTVIDCAGTRLRYRRRHRWRWWRSGDFLGACSDAPEN